MSHSSLNQRKIDQFELGTTSKYISNYIQQRKALILAKLARNAYHPDRELGQAVELAKTTHIQQTQKTSFKQEAKSREYKLTMELSGLQKSNKINKNHRIIDQDKFLARNSMYQKQKQLNLQFQKRKHMCTQASNHKFYPSAQKKDEQTQRKNSYKRLQKHQETQQLTQSKKYSKNLYDQRINYKDLVKQSVRKISQEKQKSTSAQEEKQRWKQIEQIFQKVKSYQKMHKQVAKDDETQKIKQNQQKDSMQQYLQQLEAKQIQLSMKRIESDEENIKDIVSNLEMQQHFEQDLSGIMMDEDQKEEVDSSHVFQKVVNEMMLESQIVQQQFTEQKPGIDVEFIHTISILASNPNQTEQENAAAHHYHEIIQVNDEQWITDEKKVEPSEQHIEIKKVESQIIQHSELIQKPQEAQMAESKVEIINSIQDYIENQSDKPNNQSLIHKLQQQLIEKDEKEAQDASEAQDDKEEKKVNSNEESFSQSNNRIQKQSLGMLANQFILASTRRKSNQDDDIDIPDQEQPEITVQKFDFSKINHPLTAEIVSKTAIMEHHDANIQNQNQTQDMTNEIAEQQNEETVEQIDQQEVMQYEQIRTVSTMRTFLNFGEFLSIPEESEQESRQSIG